ncbi:MAG TPA: NAD(P)-dependent oxidoreductase [Allosphingosinicella sp.]
MRSIVFGAGGLLGAHLVPVLTEQGPVHAVGRSAVAAASGVTPLAIDLAKAIDPATLPSEIDSVAYLAQSSRFRDFPEAAGDIFQVNTASLLAMLDFARRAGARNFVYASTGGVYAPSDDVVTETSPLASPMGFYPASKRAAELLCEAFAPFMNVVILRYFFIYGPGQKRDMLIPRLVDNVREGRPIGLDGQDGLRINPVHAADAAAATAAAMRLDRSATVNVAGPETLSLRDIACAIGASVGREPNFEVHADRRPASLIAGTAGMADLLVPPRRRLADSIADLL